MIPEYLRCVRCWNVDGSGGTGGGGARGRGGVARVLLEGLVADLLAGLVPVLLASSVPVLLAGLVPVLLAGLVLVLLAGLVLLASLAADLPLGGDLCFVAAVVRVRDRSDGFSAAGGIGGGAPRGREDVTAVFLTGSLAALLPLLLAGLVPASLCLDESFVALDVVWDLASLSAFALESFALDRVVGPC